MKRYNYPDSFGDMGEYLSEHDFNTMADWPAMRDWYNDAVAGGYEGTYQDYIEEQQARCSVAVEGRRPN